jgi:hypothetical protein
LGNRGPQDYLEVASSEFRAADALRDDLLAVLFPRGAALPTELLQTRVKLKLRALVDGIERQLLGNDCTTTRSWEPLADAGLLRESALIEFALARIAEDSLKQNMQGAENVNALAQLPTILLSHSNDRLADMARKLLHAEQRAASGDNLHSGLAGEHLHLLCWRVVAALQDAKVAENSDLLAAGQAVLAAHSDTANPAAIARKLVFFLGPDHRDALVDPRKAGLQLFVASLAQEYGLTSDLIFRLLGEGSMAVLLLMLRGIGANVEHVPAILMALLGERLGDAASTVQAEYASLDPVEARATIASWMTEGDPLA